MAGVPTLPVNAYESPDHVITYHAASDLSAAQFLFMGVPDLNNRVALAADGAASVGVLQNKPAAIDRAASVMGSGISFVIAYAAITSGAKVCAASDGSGRAVAATSGKHVLGIALQTVTAQGNYVSVLLDNQGVLA